MRTTEIINWVGELRISYGFSKEWGPLKRKTFKTTAGGGKKMLVLCPLSFLLHIIPLDLKYCWRLHKF